MVVALVVISAFFYFLVTNTGQDTSRKAVAQTVSDNENLDITAVVQSPNQNPPGGVGSVPVGAVTLSGVTFPNAKITLLRDGQVTTTLFANTDGSFRILLNGLNLGIYQFAIFAEDRNGVQSAPYVINAVVLQLTGYNVQNIIIPPTITARPTQLSSGQTLTVFGYAPAGSSVLISIPGQPALANTLADQTGFYNSEIRASLSKGVYPFRSKATVGTITSPESRPVDVYIDLPQPKPDPVIAACVDYNRDGRVNLIDFSILLFWFGKDSPPARIDCNHDTRIDIKDFSLLMYYWTG